MFIVHILYTNLLSMVLIKVNYEIIMVDFSFILKTDINECTSVDNCWGGTCVNLQGSFNCVYSNHRLAIGKPCNFLFQIHFRPFKDV